MEIYGVLHIIGLQMTIIQQTSPMQCVVCYLKYIRDLFTPRFRRLNLNQRRQYCTVGNTQGFSYGNPQWTIIIRGARVSGFYSTAAAAAVVYCHTVIRIPSAHMHI